MSLFIFVVVLLFGSVFAKEEIVCQPPKSIPDVEKAPTVYYSSDSKQCDMFHACSLTTRTATQSFLCDDGLVFDGIRCTLPHGVDCTSRRLLQTPQPSADCPRQNGIFKLEECNKYLHCTRGQGTVYTCAGTLIFDDEKGVCAHADMVARGKSECSEEVRYKFKCPVLSGHQLYRSPVDCRAFFTCAFPAYRPHLGGCPFETVFNEMTQRCDDPKNVPGCENYYDNQ